MKKTITILSCLLLTTLSSAQNEITYGIEAGLNYYSLNGDYPDELVTSGNIGLKFGGLFNKEFTDQFSLQLELLYSRQGGDTKVEEFYTDFEGNMFNESLTQEIRLDYVNLPILLRYRSDFKLFFEGGLQLGFIASAKSKFIYEDSVFPEDNESISINMLEDQSFNFLGTNIQTQASLNRLEVGLLLGTGYEFNDNLALGVSYHLGLTSIDKNSTYVRDFDSWNLKNSVISFTVEYSIGNFRL